MTDNLKNKLATMSPDDLLDYATLNRNRCLRLVEENNQLLLLARRMIHTIRSGILGADNVQAMTVAAKELGVIK